MRDRIMNGLIMIAAGVAVAMFTNWSSKNDDQNKKNVEKLITDIKIEVRQEMQPDIDSKLPISTHEAYVNNHLEKHRMEQENIKMLIDHIDKRFDDLKIWLKNN